MEDNYAKIVRDNIERLFQSPEAVRNLCERLPAQTDGKSVTFQAFGESCRMGADGIFLGNRKEEGPRGIILSLYALNAPDIPMTLFPLRAFKDFPNSMPYAGAFATHTQNVLIPHVERIKTRCGGVISAMDGGIGAAGAGGDFSFRVTPLPKIALCYIFYDADEEFPASVTCLYSANADRFLPMDALADVGEYCSKKILEAV